MAYQTGTATGHKDLLAKLRTFATANGWTSEQWSNPASGEHELVLKSTGVGGDDSICVGYRTVSNTASDYFNWDLWTGPTYTGGDFWSQAGQSPRRCLLLWGNSIPYWFVVTKRSIIVVANVSTTYHVSYNGLITTYTSRGHWVSPLASGASSSVNTLRWSDTSDNVGGIQKVNGSATITVRDKDGNWANVHTMYPHSGGGPILLNGYASGNKAVQQYIYFASDRVLGEPDNLFYVNGATLQAGQTLDNAQGNFVCIPNIFRSGVQDFYAVRLV